MAGTLGLGLVGTTPRHLADTLAPGAVPGTLSLPGGGVDAPGPGRNPPAHGHAVYQLCRVAGRGPGRLCHRADDPQPGVPGVDGPRRRTWLAAAARCRV